MPMFTNTYTKKVRVSAPASNLPNASCALTAMYKPRPIINKYRLSKTHTPNKPNSSLKTENIKSVWRSGKNSNCDCVPSNQPLPSMPPDPIAIFD